MQTPDITGVSMHHYTDTAQPLQNLFIPEKGDAGLVPIHTEHSRNNPDINTGNCM